MAHKSPGGKSGGTNANRIGTMKSTFDKEAFQRGSLPYLLMTSHSVSREILHEKVAEFIRQQIEGK